MSGTEPPVRHQRVDPAAPGDAPDPIFGVLREPRTYLNLAYLLLSFPLGIAYFALIVTGLSLGLGLAVIWIGLPILAGVLVMALGLAALERELAVRLLGVDFARQEPSAAGLPSAGPWERLWRSLRSPSAWLNLVYLLTRFPLGVASFVLIVTLVAGGGGLMLTPLFYDQPWWQVSLGVWRVDSLSDAAAAGVVGAAMALAGLHLGNGLAWLYGRYAQAMLSPGGGTPPART